MQNPNESHKYFGKVEDGDCMECNRAHVRDAEPSNIFAFDTTVGLNVGMSGDTSDSSDTDDNCSNELNKPYGLVGLQNIGNTCYMNAALQALSNTLPLTNFFLECSASVMLLSEGKKPGLSRTYQTLIKDMWIKKKYGYVNPSGILYGIRNVHAMFRGYHQHDTQEFLRNFMDQLHEELKQICPRELFNDVEAYSLTLEESSMNSSFESSEGEYETCDSGVSERSSLSDDTERPAVSKHRLSQSTSPCHRLRSHFQNASGEPQSSNSSTYSSADSKRQVKYRSIISDIFDGKLLSSVQCLTCSRISSRVETFQDLSLPIPSRDHLAVLHGRNMEIGGASCSETVVATQDGWISWLLSWLRSWFYGPTVSLHDCLSAFFSTDELKGDNMYSCERCNKLRNGIKFSKVLQLPEVLCIHLKRFRHELMFSSKISSFVSFPLKDLDVQPYLHTDCISNVTVFDLFAVICHHGTAGGGHYTCFSLNGNQWYEFDDQYVTKVSPETVQASEAYVLFYRKSTTVAQAVKAKACEIAELSNNTPEECAYISKQWLSRFKTCAEPGPIDNSDFLCVHNAINPERSILLHQLAVPIPKQVYDYLFKKFGGSPPVVITELQICSICQIILKRISYEFETFLKINRDFVNRRLSSTHLLSATWFEQWQNFVEKRNYDPPGPIENIRVLAGVSNDFIEINNEMWQFFYNIYGGGPEMPIFTNKTSPQSIEDAYNSAGNTPQMCDTSNNVTMKKPLTKNKHCNNVEKVQECEHPQEVVEQGNSKMDEGAATANANGVFDDSYSSNVGVKNTDRCSPDISSRSSSLTDDDEAQGDMSVESNRSVLKGISKDKLLYKTKKRRFRCRIGYKSRNLSNINKNVKYKGFC